MPAPKHLLLPLHLCHFVMCNAKTGAARPLPWKPHLEDVLSRYQAPVPSWNVQIPRSIHAELSGLRPALHTISLISVGR